MKLPYAENINYWKTSQSSPDNWIEKATKQIQSLGGKVYTHAFGQDDEGASAYMMLFSINEDQFKVVWPVLPSRTGKEIAAKRQAATLLYHDIKAKCLSATVKGTREAFFQYLLLPNGRTTSQASIPELLEGIPLSLAGYDILQLKEKL